MENKISATVKLVGDYKYVVRLLARLEKAAKKYGMECTADIEKGAVNLGKEEPGEEKK